MQLLQPQSQLLLQLCWVLLDLEIQELLEVASLQGALYGGATPAGGLFATCTSAAMGGQMGSAAVTAVAVTGGAAVAVGAGYGVYRIWNQNVKEEK